MNHPLPKPICGLSPLQALQDYNRRTRIDRNQQAHLYTEGLLQKVLNTSGRDPMTQEELPEGATLNQQSPNPTNDTGGAARGSHMQPTIPNPTNDTGGATQESHTRYQQLASPRLNKIPHSVCGLQ